MEGHFQNQMKQILIDLDIGLLIIELSDLQSHKIIFQGYFYLLPYLKLLAQFQEYLYCQLNLLQYKTILVPDPILSFLDLEVLQFYGLVAFEVLEVEGQDVFTFDVGEGQFQFQGGLGRLQQTQTALRFAIDLILYFVALACKMDLFGRTELILAEQQRSILQQFLIFRLRLSLELSDLFNIGIFVLFLSHQRGISDIVVQDYPHVLRQQMFFQD